MKPNVIKGSGRRVQVKIGGKDVPEWDGEPVAAIVCVTTNYMALPGSTIEHCHDCREEVWLAESSLEVLLKYPTTPITCIACVTKIVENQDKVVRVDDGWPRGMQT